MYRNDSQICWNITSLLVKELFGSIYVFTITKSSDSKLPKLTQKNTSWRKYQFHDRRRSSQRAAYLTGIDKYKRLYYLSYVSSWFYFLYGVIVSKPYFFFTADPPGPLILVFDVNWFLAEEYPGDTTFLLTVIIFSSRLFSEESDKENVHYSKSTCKVFRHELLRYEKSNFS